MTTLKKHKLFMSLLKAFRALIGEEFDKTNYKHRLKMHKLAYLYETITNSKTFTPYIWVVNGPQSASLTEMMLKTRR